MTSTTFFLVFIPLLAVILLLVNLIFASHNPYKEKNSAFECGFHSFLGQNRTQFSISFFIFALLFLLFDLEILLVYPYIVSAYINDIYGLVVTLIFFLVLTLGFAFELGKNALKIDSKQLLSVVSKQLYVKAILAFNSPPKPHTFVSLPLVSKVNIKLINLKFSNLKEKFTLKNICITLVCLVFAYLLKLSINYLFTLDLDIWEGLFSLGLFLGLFEISYCMDIDDLLNPGSTPRPSRAALPPQPQPQPTAQPQVPVQQPVIQQPPTHQPHGVIRPVQFSLGVAANIPDASGVGVRGYAINGQNQPYARSIATAMQTYFNQENSMIMPNLDPVARRFFIQFINHNYPDVANHHSRCYNTRAIRKHLSSANA